MVNSPTRQHNTIWTHINQGLSLLHGCTFLGYGFFDHPRFTRAVRHLPVHEITSACRTILGRETPCVAHAYTLPFLGSASNNA